MTSILSYIMRSPEIGASELCLFGFKIPLLLVFFFLFLLLPHFCLLYKEIYIILIPTAISWNKIKVCTFKTFSFFSHLKSGTDTDSRRWSKYMVCILESILFNRCLDIIVEERHWLAAHWSSTHLLFLQTIISQMLVSIHFSMDFRISVESTAGSSRGFKTMCTLWDSSLSKAELIS